MSLQSRIRDKLKILKATNTTVYTSNGDVFEEVRNKNGEVIQTKLVNNFIGFIPDLKPNLIVSKILPWLYMGSQDVAYDYELLKTYNISYILSLGIKCPAYKNIEVYFFEVQDLETFSIDLIFHKCIKIIDQIRNKGIIYVHCNAGISRSATIVTAYLIQYLKINDVEALNILKSIRPEVNPNSGFLKKLEKFSEDCKNRNYIN